MYIIVCIAYTRRCTLSSGTISLQNTAAPGYYVVQGSWLSSQASRAGSAWALSTDKPWNGCKSQAASDYPSYPHQSQETYLWMFPALFHMGLLVNSCFSLDSPSTVPQVKLHRHITTHISLVTPPTWCSHSLILFHYIECTNNESITHLSMQNDIHDAATGSK